MLGPAAVSPNNKMVRSFSNSHSKTSFEKNCFFSVDEYAEYGFDQQG